MSGVNVYEELRVLGLDGVRREEASWSRSKTSWLLAGPHILRTAWLLTGSREDAEDLVQTALVNCSAYMRAVASGDMNKASEYVATAQRGMLQALALGNGPGTLPMVTGHMAVGKVDEVGDSALVSFVGKLCRTAPNTENPAAESEPECIGNQDPDTTSPLFLVQLAKSDQDGWQVVLGAAPK